MKGHLEARGRNRWTIVLELGTGPDGKRIRHCSTYHGNKRDADIELVRLLRELETGTYVDHNRIRVDEYLAHWLANYAKPTVGERTYDRYKEIVDLHLAPALGRMRLKDLRPAHIQSYYTKAGQSGRIDGKGGLSAQTILHHHRVLHEALKQAVRWQMLVVNPADAVRPPRPERKEARVLDAAETARLLKLLEGTEFHTPALVAVTTGLRRGELLGLRWRDVDLEVGRLTVMQNLQQTRTAGLLYKSPKTAKGKRSMPLLPVTLAALKKHRREQAARFLQRGLGFHEDALVFCLEDGSAWPPNSFSAEWPRLMKSLGWTLRFHDLRHTHATLLLRQGTHPKVVSERLGHSTIGITLDTYSHVMPDLQDEATKLLDLTLGAAMNEAQLMGL